MEDEAAGFGGLTVAGEAVAVEEGFTRGGLGGEEGGEDEEGEDDLHGLIVVYSAGDAGTSD